MGPNWLHFPEDFLGGSGEGLRWKLTKVSVSLATKGPRPAVHLGVWQDLVDDFIKLFKNELPPLFFEIFAYIHFLTFLSIFPPFPHMHSEIACFSFRVQAAAPGSLGGWGCGRTVGPSWSWRAAGQGEGALAPDQGRNYHRQA